MICDIWTDILKYIRTRGVKREDLMLSITQLTAFCFLYAWTHTWEIAEISPTFWMCQLIPFLACDVFFYSKLKSILSCLDLRPRMHLSPCNVMIKKKTYRNYIHALEDTKITQIPWSTMLDNAKLVSVRPIKCSITNQLFRQLLMLIYLFC